MFDYDLLGSPGASGSQSDEPDEQAELASFCARVQLGSGSVP